MEEYVSSHAIIKALKGSSDPPKPGGPLKIEIARHAWTADIYFPNKEEVLLEWILSTFLRERSVATTIVSTSHWSLIRDILIANSAARTSRTMKVWLSSLLNRVALANIVGAFFSNILVVREHGDRQLLDLSVQCLQILWPLSAARMNLDALTDCFTSVLHYLSNNASRNIEFYPVCISVVRSFRQSVNNSSNKKKVYSTFVKSCLEHWIKYICSEIHLTSSKEAIEKSLKSEVQQAGIEILFSMECLKSSPEYFEILLTQSIITEKFTTEHLCVLPLLYRAYVQETQKHRLSAFGSGSGLSQEQAALNKARGAGMAAFIVCRGVLSGYGDDLEVWCSTLSILEVLEEANIVSHGLSPDTQVLRDIASWAVNCLSISSRDPDRSQFALRVLSVLSRIDIDMVSPCMKDLLSHVLTMSPLAFTNIQELMHELLNFHSKTKTLHTYLISYIGCLAGIQDRVLNDFSDTLKAHQACASGALLAIPHIEELSRAIKGFLTAGQALETIRMVLDNLKASWVSFLYGDTDNEPMEIDPDISETPRKRKRSNTQVLGSRQKHEQVATSQTKERTAVTYSLLARAAANILPSIPFPTLPDSTQDSIQSIVIDAWKGFMAKATALPFTGDSPSWAEQIISAATLRILHALQTSPYLCISDLSIITIGPLGKYAQLIRSVETIPELTIELLRCFFDTMISIAEQHERDEILQAMMGYLRSNLGFYSGNGNMIGKNMQATSVAWDASTSSLSSRDPSTHRRGALAVLHLALDRWLPIIDTIAPKEFLKDLTEVFLLLPYFVDDINLGGISVSWILKRATRSAAFWELANLRDAMTLTFNDVTSHANWDDFGMLLKQTQQGQKKFAFHWDEQQVLSVTSAFEMMLRGPKEYLPRSAKITFVQRALVSDLAVFLSSRRSVVSVDLGLRAHAVIRAWLDSVSDMACFVDYTDDVIDYLKYLITSTVWTGATQGIYRNTTLKLLAIAQRQIVRDASRGSELPLQNLCSLLRDTLHSPSETHDQFISEEALLQFIDILTRELQSHEKLSATSRDVINRFLLDLSSVYLGRMEGLLEAAEGATNSAVSIVCAWKTLLVLRRWLSITGAAKCFGSDLLQRLVISLQNCSPNGLYRDLGTQVFLLLLEELQLVPQEEREVHLSLCISAYVVLREHGLFEEVDCDISLRRFSRSLPSLDYLHVLLLLREALASGVLDRKRMQIVVHLQGLFVGANPEGTSKIVQENIEACLQAFSANLALFADDVDLSIEILTYIASTCSEKAALMRTLSVGLTWSFLSKLLTGSVVHLVETNHSILQNIVNIAMALVRLRRDLVQSSLPHLCHVLRGLIRTLRSPRSQLGARQLSQVADTLPWWVNPAQPLNSEDARAVARLLTSLEAKTIPRTFLSKDKEKEKGNTMGIDQPYWLRKQQRAESLSSAFSKHAGPVLAAHAAALADPLVVHAANVREALAPGLYALCASLGGHGRDNLMAGALELDAGARSAFKAIWQEYEKQKYTGKG